MRSASDKIASSALRVAISTDPLLLGFKAVGNEILSLPTYDTCDSRFCLYNFSRRFLPTYEAMEIVYIQQLG
jgi:hypothetical protein